MCIYSTFWLEWEKENLAPYAVHSDHPWYAQRAESNTTPDDRYGSRSRYRTAFEIDKDRITNSQAFRRLEYKTQVFVTHEGDNYRTRLTHSLEVSEIARHIARSLRLNEHLVEAIALGHDLGHAPYGHIAERTINSWLKDIHPPMHTFYHFCHNNHSVENVDHLEPGYDWDLREPNEGFAQGLNLTLAVREGLLAHTSMGFRGIVHKKARFNKDFEESIRKLSDSNRVKGLFLPGSLEAQAVRIADDLAQRIHDIEDGLRSDMLNKEDIGKVLIEFLSKLTTEIFDHRDKDKINIDNIASRDYLEHKYFHTKISKIFLNDVIEMYFQSDMTSRQQPESPSIRVNSINERLRDDDRYRNLFIRAAQVAFLLHMWRDDDYLRRLSIIELDAYKLRLFKYLRFLCNIIDNDGNSYPAYHIIAFLRGSMLANVIEHSFWQIHKRIDPDFRTLVPGIIDDKLSDPHDKYYIVFVIVDGFTYANKENRIIFDSVENNKRLYCFEFDSDREMREFLEHQFKDILSTNGSYLLDSKLNYRILQRVCWLNKYEVPGKTRIIGLCDGQSDIKVRLDKVNIYFTGYKELCPGIRSGTCNFGSQHGQTCYNSKSCTFWTDKIKYPDINRLITLQDHMYLLDQMLKKLISSKIHHGSRVARMNYMGNKIIRNLLDLYLKDPRLMHDRVWSRLRVYRNMENVSLSLQQWVDRALSDKEKSVLDEEVFKCLTEPDHANRKCNHFTLVRRIIEHVAGMTDRYISNEFNRLNQSGREVEGQDETYFFY